MLRQSREDCYDVIVVILNLQGFSNIIHPQWLLFFIKTRLRPSEKAAGEWRACRKVSRPKKTKVNASPKQKGLLRCYCRYFKPSRFSKP
ncbi:MAG: hypothetical protein GDA51_06580 [Ekhidna sp.]|nr:hypothetical protein [Ekhidna sp.]